MELVNRWTVGTPLGPKHAKAGAPDTYPFGLQTSVMLRDVDYVLRKLDWMRAEGIWPNGLRYLWTDAFGVVLYVSLYKELGEERWLGEAERLVAEVERVLGRPRGLRIGEAADRDGPYFHYLAMWLFALARLGDLKPRYRARGVELARDIHPAAA
ncbi:hypothetical protein [Mesorhizobium sp.]|uniref:hypothetical protein n=1 Tax=Mesorhizobium sp. TaxID=1871066 RepID=UPI0025ED5D92|nr:hypothetical protein [Mesorhizobium sp.]